MNIKYPYLPEGRTFIYVGMDNPFMKEAYEVARKLSTDSIQPTSAVVVKDGVVIGRGANQVPVKNKTFQDLHRKGWCVRKFLKIKSGTKYWMCPGCSPHKNHAEPQSIQDAQKRGNHTDGADLYHWGHWWCCKSCWDTMIASGIKNVYLLSGSETLFNQGSKDNILGKQFQHER